MPDWENVSVQPEQGGEYLLQGGTGSGGEATFACSPFDPQNLPTVDVEYYISATPEGGVDAMTWVAMCTFAGVTSEFQEV